MSYDIAIIIERVRQAREAHDRAFNAARASARDGATPIPGGFSRGARVFDTVSGLEGDVIHGTRQNLLVSATPR